MQVETRRITLSGAAAKEVIHLLFLVGRAASSQREGLAQ